MIEASVLRVMRTELSKLARDQRADALDTPDGVGDELRDDLRLERVKRLPRAKVKDKKRDAYLP